MISINSRQRAYLKSAAMTMDAIFQVGKSGITPELTKAVDEALEARELIKLNMLKAALTIRKQRPLHCQNGQDPWSSR